MKTEQGQMEGITCHAQRSCAHSESCPSLLHGWRGEELGCVGTYGRQRNNDEALIKSLNVAGEVRGPCECLSAIRNA
jgi:hypothetical protein